MRQKVRCTEGSKWEGGGGRGAIFLAYITISLQLNNDKLNDKPLSL